MPVNTIDHDDIVPMRNQPIVGMIIHMNLIDEIYTYYDIFVRTPDPFDICICEYR